MSINFDPDILNFPYLSLKRLRDEGFDAGSTPDDRARQLVKLCSKKIHTFMGGLFFFPINFKWVVNPRNKSLAHTPNFDRIAELSSFGIGLLGSGFSPFSQGSFSVEDRQVKVLTSSCCSLPSTPASVELAGLFGDYSGGLVQTPLTVDTVASKGATTIVFTAPVAAIDFVSGEVLLDKSKFFPDSIPVLIDEADGSPTVKVEPLSKDIQSGTVLTRVGSIHADIELATLYLFRDLFSLGSVGVPGLNGVNAQSSNPLHVKAGRNVLRESTGRASWEFNKGILTENAKYMANVARTTGNMGTDQILMGYFPNVFYMGVI